jgi:hypothetical protein
MNGLAHCNRVRHHPYPLSPGEQGLLHPSIQKSANHPEAQTSLAGVLKKVILRLFNAHPHQFSRSQRSIEQLENRPA